MVAYARARTRSWLSILWPETDQPINNATVDLDNHEEQLKRNKHFLEVSKNGGMWFS